MVKSILFNLVNYVSSYYTDRMDHHYHLYQGILTLNNSSKHIKYYFRDYHDIITYFTKRYIIYQENIYERMFFHRIYYNKIIEPKIQKIYFWNKNKYFYYDHRITFNGKKIILLDNFKIFYPFNKRIYLTNNSYKNIAYFNEGETVSIYAIETSDAYLVKIIGTQQNILDTIYYNKLISITNSLIIVSSMILFGITFLINFKRS